MILTVFFVFLILMIVGYLRSKSLFAPYVLMSASWLVILLLFIVFDTALIPLEGRFLGHLLLWGFFFYMSSMITEAITPPSKNENSVLEPNKGVLRVYWVLFAISVIIISYESISLALQYGKLFYFLRVINVGFSDDIQLEFGILNNFTVFGIIVYLIELSRYSPENRTRTWVLLALNLIFSFITMAKSSFFVLVISSTYILYFQEKIKLRNIVLLFLVFFGFALVLQQLRAFEDDVVTVNTFMSMYLMSGAAAFDVTDFPDPTYWGENTFRLYYAIMHSIGGSDVPPVNTVLEFTNVGVLTNIYTSMYPFYVDFKTGGVLIFALITGAFMGFLSKKAHTGGQIQQIQYAYFSSYIILQFTGEFLFTNLSLTLQLMLYAALPYMLYKSKIVTND